MLDQIVRGRLLIPRIGGHVDYFADGVIASSNGAIEYVGDWAGLATQLSADAPPVRVADGVMLPPLLDIHTHIPQHPIRGRFVEGIPDDAPGGKLLTGLQQNVFPAEIRCNQRGYAEEVTRQFLADTLRHGVIGGAAYMTPSAVATEAALSILPETWSVGLVLMNQNCPPDLRTDEAEVEHQIERLAGRFGRRLIVTDRFAVTVSTPLRRRAAVQAGRLGLRTQTHLNEQVGEKQLVEQTLYPDADSYTDIYRKDGLLDHACILAHCIQMRPEEWRILSGTGSVIAHCPTSNLLLGSGVMPLDEVIARKIPYAIATDVGASPTVSILAEMQRFMTVHAGRSTRATPSEALYRATLAPAEILYLARQTGRLEKGQPMSFIEVTLRVPLPQDASPDEVIRALLPEHLDDPSPTVKRVTVGGQVRDISLKPAIQAEDRRPTPT